VLDPAGGEHVVPRPHGEAATAGVDCGHGADGARLIDIEPGHGGTQQHRDRACAPQPLAIRFAHALHADVEDGVRERAGADGQRLVAVARAPDVRVVLERAEPDDLVRAPVTGQQAVEAERPAGLAELCALLEVDGIERPAPAGPHAGRAAERGEPRAVQVRVPVRLDRAFHQPLRRGGVRLATGLEHAHRLPAAGELQRERDARRARADDARVAVHAVSGLERGRVQDHRSAPRPRETAASGAACVRSMAVPSNSGGAGTPRWCRAVGTRSTMWCSPAARPPAGTPGPRAMNHARSVWLPERPDGRSGGTSYENPGSIVDASFRVAPAVGPAQRTTRSGSSARPGAPSGASAHARTTSRTIGSPVSASRRLDSSSLSSAHSASYSAP